MTRYKRVAVDLIIARGSPMVRAAGTAGCASRGSVAGYLAHEIPGAWLWCHWWRMAPCRPRFEGRYAKMVRWMQRLSMPTCAVRYSACRPRSQAVEAVGTAWSGQCSVAGAVVCPGRCAGHGHNGIPGGEQTDLVRGPVPGPYRCVRRPLRKHSYGCIRVVTSRRRRLAQGHGPAHRQTPSPNAASRGSSSRW
jgi:hypothetical protein